jgi:Microcystin-dependent protein
MWDNAYIGEIRIFGGNFAPKGWLFCNGQELVIRENTVLYGLIGTSYGGDGITHFKLPDLRGRLPVHNNAQLPLGKAFGAETVKLDSRDLPAHTHEPMAHSTAADSTSPENHYWGNSTGVSNYLTAVHPNAEMHALSIAPSGGGQSHDNMMPSLAVSFIIAVEGYSPQRTGHGLDEQFVGEIRAFAFNFAPSGWEPCNGQKRVVNQDLQLYTVIKDIYGGDRKQSFNLPNLQGRVPVQAGRGIKLGEQGGESIHKLALNEMPAHTHQIYGSNTVPSSTAVAKMSWANPSSPKIYAADSDTKMNHEAIVSAGGGQPHENQQPSLAVSFCIALTGVNPNSN